MGKTLGQAGAAEACSGLGSGRHRQQAQAPGLSAAGRAVDRWPEPGSLNLTVRGCAALLVGVVAIAAGNGCGPNGFDPPASLTAVATVAEQAGHVRAGRGDRVVAATPLTESEWESLRGLAGLKELLLQAGRADDARAKILASLPDIERLVLRDSPLTDDGFRELAACTTLRDLNVPKASCTAAGVQSLAELPRLRSLRLGGTRLGGREICEAIVRLPHLRTLHLIDIPIGDDGLAVLASRPDLWNLYLDGAGASDTAWQRYFEACPTVHVHVDQAHHDRDPGRAHE